MKYKRKYQTGGQTDPPTSKFFQDLYSVGNFFTGTPKGVVNRDTARFPKAGGDNNINANMSRLRGMREPTNPPLPYDVQLDEGKATPMSSGKGKPKNRYGEGTVRTWLAPPKYPLPDQRQPSLLPDYADPFEISHYNPPGQQQQAPQQPDAPAPVDAGVESAPQPSPEPPPTDIGMNRNLESPTLGTEPDVSPTTDVASKIAQATPSEESGFKMPWTEIAQYGPDILNFATGVFGKDKTRPATQVSNRAADMIDDRVNVNPQLQQARASYRAIVNNPNATANQKLAAQAQMNNAMNQIYSDKFNRQQQLRANKASIQANLDSQRARYAEQYRQDKMASEANLGLTGNFARKALGDISTKVLQDKAMKAKETGDKRDILAYISSLPEAVQTRLLKQYDLD